MSVEARTAIAGMSSDDVSDDVLTAYLIGVEALRDGKESVMWFTPDGIFVATEGSPPRRTPGPARSRDGGSSIHTP